MSEIKTNKISPRKGTTTTIGDSGDTIATGSGTTLNIQGTYSGINVISWDTTAKTANFTAETNKGYFINTTSGQVTINLPATPAAGSFIGIKDYALTAQTNYIVINPNGNKIQGRTNNFLIKTQGGAANLVYVDSTKGWLTFDAAQASDITEPLFITATGGTITTCGDYKIHTFTGPGTFCVSCAGNPVGGPSNVDYLVLAGGGGGGGGNNTPGGWYGGGGGAGGYRESPGTETGSYTVSPLGVAPAAALPVTVQGYPITVGGGGSGGSRSKGSNGGNSVFSTITSTAGGGGGGSNTPGSAGNPGGSGGGGNGIAGGLGSGNTPPVTPPQGNNGGAGSPTPHVFAVAGGGGGGATATGRIGRDPAPSGSPYGGPGGAGATSSINGTPTTRAGGGGGSSQQPAGGSGGSGGGGAGANNGAGGGTNATANTGSGGGGGNDGKGGNGAGGLVIIRYKYQ